MVEADSKQAATDMIRELERQLHQKEAEIAMLREITTVIGGETNLQKVFNLVADSARDLIKAETVTIPILTNDQSSYVYRAAAGRNAEELINALARVPGLKVTARTSSSASASSNAAIISCIIVPVKAFIFSGRSTVTMAMSPSQLTDMF